MILNYAQLLVCFVGFFEAIVYGYSFPYFALILENRGASATLIGANTLMGTIGALIVAPLVPKLCVKYGYRRVSLAAMSVVAFILLAATHYNATIPLFLYRFVLGLVLAALWISTEAWLNHVAGQENRGFLNGIFQTFYSFGFFVGPLIAKFTFVDVNIGPLSACISAGLGMLSCILFKAHSADDGDGDFEAQMDWGIAWQARGLLLIALLTGVAEIAMYTLLPIYGVKLGFGYEVAISILVFYTLGEVVLTFPLAWLSDRVNRRILLPVIALFATVAIIALSVSGDREIPASAASFVAGGLIVSLYNIALIVLGETYRGTHLAVVSASFSMAYTVGCAGGAAIAGVAMDIVGPYGLPLAVGTILAIFGVLTAIAFNLSSQTQERLSDSRAEADPAKYR